MQRPDPVRKNAPLAALLFHNLRFTPAKAHRNMKCLNCKQGIKKGDPVMKGRGFKIRLLHPACAEAIAEHNEHARKAPNTDEGSKI